MRDVALPQLPGELVTHVLRHVEQQQRLGSCALVSHAWRSAAVAASSDVTLAPKAQPHTALKLESLGQWLSQHAAAVTQLVVDYTYRSDRMVFAMPGTYAAKVLQLPAAQLRRLQKLAVFNCNLIVQADDCDLQQQQQQQPNHTLASHCSSSGSGAGAGSSASGGDGRCQALATLTSLISLVLRRVDLAGPAGLGGLSALTGLQELQLKHVTMRAVSDQNQQQLQLQQDSLLGLGSLKQLTRLVLDDCWLPERAVAPFSCLQQLRELILPGDVSSTDTLQRLPLSLTMFEMAWGGQQELSSSLCPDLAALTNLQHLDVYAPSGDDDEATALLPDFCSSMQQLRVLTLDGLMSPDALLALAQVLPVLSRLERLTISNTNTELAPLPDSNAAAYSALLPLSPHITHLELSWDHFDDSEHAAILRTGCAQHLFAAGRQLPQLKQLVLGVPAQSWEWVDGVAGFGYHVSRASACLGENSISRLVSCCPGLEQLWLAGAVHPGVDMRPLLQLTALRDLSVGGLVVTSDVACDVLAQLSSLQRLGVYAASSFTDRGLLALTALRQLTRLAVGGCGISREVSRDFASDKATNSYEGECLELQVQESLPPVWLQLLSRCVRSNHKSTQYNGRSCGELALEQLLALHTGPHGWAGGSPGCS